MAGISNDNLDKQDIIKELEQAEGYKYLGVIDGGGNQTFSFEEKDQKRMSSQSKGNI